MTSQLFAALVSTGVEGAIVGKALYAGKFTLATSSERSAVNDAVCPHNSLP